MKTMKRIIPFLISIFVTSGLFAQAVLTSNINLSIGDSFRYDAYSNVTNVVPGPAGENQIWDFTNVTGENYSQGNVESCVNPATTPFADSSAVSQADICTYRADSSGDGHYQYYINSSSSQVITAMGDILADGNALYSEYIDGVVLYEFPFTYGNSYDYWYKSQVFDTSLGYYFKRDSTSVTVEADAYGTVSTPLTTYNNTLRIKTTIHQYYWMRFNASDDWMYIGDMVDVGYSWMAPGIKVPVLFFDFANTDEPYVHYLMDHNFPSAIKEIANNGIKLFPNPVADKITIQSERPINNIHIFSVNGQQMDAVVLPANGINNRSVDVSHYPAGVYSIEFKLKDGRKVTKKFIKIKKT